MNSHQARQAQVLQAMVYRYMVESPELGPERFFEEQLHVKLDPWQIEASRAFGRGARKISIAACHGPGKTAWVSWCVVYSLLFRHPLKAVATAPSRGQLEGALMKEVAKWVDKLQPGLRALLEVGATSVAHRTKPKAIAFEARTARPENPEALQGVHEAEGWVLIIVDEASGVHEKIFESAQGSMSQENAQTILLSNPTRTSGYFFRTHHQDRESWFRLTISWKDSSHISPKFEKELARQYGRDSNVYRVRALGQFPRTDADTIIPYELADSALRREIIMAPHLPQVWGIDVAYKGVDSNTILRRNAVGVLPKISAWEGMDTVASANRIRREYDTTPEVDRPREMLIDIIGYGAGVHDQLKDWGLPVTGVNVAETTLVDTARFRNYSSQLWWTAREWLEDRGHTLPVCDGTCPDKQSCLHDRLIMELTSRQYEPTSGGKVLIETKRDMKKRGYKSPDVADGFILTFAADESLLRPGNRGRPNYSWHAPIDMKRVHV